MTSVMSRNRGQAKIMEEDIVKRGENWTPEATSFLIELWQEYFTQLRGQRRTLPVYTRIQKRLLEQGVHKSITEIKNRINNLNQRYRKERSTIGDGSSAWPHYDAIHLFQHNIPVNSRSLPESYDDNDGNMFVSCEIVESPSQLSLNDSLVSESDDPATFSEEQKPKRRRTSKGEGESDILKSIAETQKTLVKILAQSQRAQEEFQAQFIAFQRDFMDIMRTCIQGDK